MSTRHMGTRAREHLNLDDSHEVQLKIIHQCSNGVCNLTFCKILRKCHTFYDTKIHEALLMRKTKTTTI